MKPKEIEKIYEMIKGYFEKYLQKEGVQLPKLYNKGKFSKEALVLVYLAQHYPNTKVVTKQELTEFIKKFYPNTTDVQQARHLAAQKGWYIASGTRGNGILELNQGEYKLITLEKAYPNFVRAKREATFLGRKLRRNMIIVVQLAARRKTKNISIGKVQLLSSKKHISTPESQ